MSRRIESGIEHVRDHLRQAGLVVPTVAMLAGLLSTNAAQAAPSTMITSLGKISLGATAATGVTTTTAAMSLSAGKVALIAAGIGVVLIGGVLVVPSIIGQEPAARIESNTTLENKMLMSEQDLLANVKREDGRVWIDGVKEGFNSYQHASSTHGVQATIMKVLGEDLAYDDLVAYSAFAFRTHVATDFCPSGAHPACGYPCFNVSDRALPWQTKVFKHIPGKTERSPQELETFKNETKAAIKASTDRGIPVHYDGYEAGMIVGYGDNGNRWLCFHSCHKTDRKCSGTTNQAVWPVDRTVGRGWW